MSSLKAKTFNKTWRAKTNLDDLNFNLFCFNKT